MASLCINSISPPPSHLRRHHHDSPPPSHPLKPIVVTGNPPTFVSAPDRRIVAVNTSFMPYNTILVMLVGDLHGDLAKARSAFEMAGIWQRKVLHSNLLWHLTVAYGIERINMEVSQWMQGYGEDSDEYCIPFIATRGYDSVVWNRLYSRDPSNLNYRNRKVGAIVDETLERAGAKAIVVGHTPQLEGVNCKYNNSIWRIDVGMSRGVMNSNPEVLEINNNKARAIRSELYELQEIEYL